MRKVIVMAFTDKGTVLANRIAETLSSQEFRVSVQRVSKIKEFIPSVFVTGNILVFVGAVGIAVRSIAKFVDDKTVDPAVVVVDEKGEYVIPILSGHIGGANEFAQNLSELIGATPIITTATDVNDVFAIDNYAVKNGYEIVNPERIKDISEALLNGKQVGICSTIGEISGTLPDGLISKSEGQLGIMITDSVQNEPFSKTLYLKPKCYHVGIGCRKEIDFDILQRTFLDALEQNSIPLNSVGTISSIELKKNERAILELSDLYGIKYQTFSAESMQKYEDQFEESDFVKKTTGVGNVCEISAYISSNEGEVVLKKQVGNGVSIAIAKEKWRVIF